MRPPALPFSSVEEARGRAYATLEELDDNVERLSRRQVSCGGLIIPAGVAAHRAVVCSFAIALLWCTSLAVARSLTSGFVSSPPFSAVTRECQRTHDEVKRQKRAYLECTERQTSTCDVSLKASLEVETARSHRAARDNRELVAAAVDRQDRCARRQLQALENVQRLQAAGVALAWRGGASCPAAERARAQAMVGDISAARSHAMDVATRYTQNAQLLQQMSLDGIDGVHRYDASYLGRKRAALRELPGRLDAVTSARAQQMRGTLKRLNDSMLSCGAGGGANGGGGANVGSAGGGCELPLQPQVEQMRSQYDALLTAMRQQQREMLSFHDSMESMASSIKGPLDAVAKVARQIDPGIRLPSIEVPEVHMPEVHLPPLPSIGDLKGELARWEREKQAAAQGYLSDAAGSADAMRSDVAGTAGGVDGLLDDYDPPPFNTSSARQQMRSEADRFLTDQEHALSAFATLSDHAAGLEGANGTGAPNGTLGFGSVPELIRQSGLEFEPLSSTSIDVDLLTLALGHVAWVATLCDFVWRSWRSVRLVLYYWSKASVGLPTLDLREDAASGAAANACAELGSNRCLTACFLSPVGGVAIAVMGLFLVANAATAVYVPMYMHYVDGCIAPPRNGTFLTRNLFSSAYNYAAAEGNQHLLHALDSYELARAANCSAEVRGSLVTQRQAARKAEVAQASYRAALADVRLMRACLRADELDAKAAAARVRPYVPLVAVLGEDACDGGGGGGGGGGLRGTEEVVLADSVYNCSAVAPCERVCDGPSREITATFCQRCGCHAEWFGHGLVLNVLLALFVFASLNAFRYLLVDAVCRILWRKLFAGQFEYIANCDDRGETKVGRKEILEALRDAVRGHVRTGWLLVVGACALNVPWIFALSYVGEHLDVGHSMAPGALA